MIGDREADNICSNKAKEVELILEQRRGKIKAEIAKTIRNSQISEKIEEIINENIKDLGLKVPQDPLYLTILHTLNVYNFRIRDLKKQYVKRNVSSEILLKASPIWRD